MKERIIGDWHIGEKIGYGGQSEVFEARGGEGQTLCALKLINTKNIKRRKRFITEVEKHQKLSQEGVKNIIPIIDHNLDAFIDGEKKGYIVMPRAVTTLADQTSITIGRIDLCVEIFHGILIGMDAAHSLGVIHRDLKPKNILFLDASLREPLISDFGICYTKDTPYDERITELNETVGAKFYMAPEQERGEIIDVDETVDIYALGKLLHFTLTGRHLFREELDKAFYDEEIQSDIRYSRILENILSKTVIFDKSKRLKSVSDLMLATEKILSTRIVKKKENINHQNSADTIKESKPGDLNNKNLYEEYCKMVSNSSSPSTLLVIDDLKTKFTENWKIIREEFSTKVDEVDIASTKLIDSMSNTILLLFAIGRTDAFIYFNEIKKLIHHVLNSSENMGGYVAINAIPNVLAGYIYMTASIAAYHFGAWSLLKELFNTKFEWYFDSGRPFFSYGFGTSRFFHSEAMARSATKTHDFYREKLNKPEYQKILNLDSDQLLNVYLQTQMLMCFRAAQERQNGNDSKIWADFGRFFSTRVNKFFYRLKNDIDLQDGISKCFNESSSEWINQIKDRLTIIVNNFFGTGSGFWWESIDPQYLDDLVD